MLSKFYNAARKTRHFWRYATFTEVGILYASRILRLLAINLSSVFILIFLYELGYSLQFLIFYLVGYYCCKFVGAFVGGFMLQNTAQNTEFY